MNQNIVELTKKTAEVFQSAQLPNCDMLDFQGKNLIAKIGKQTSKKVE